jgi:hypothetical protein
MAEKFRLRRYCGFAKRRWPFQQKVEFLFARLAKTLPLPEAQGSASLKHLDPHGQAGVLARHLRQHRRPKTASLKFGLHVKGVNMQMIGARLSANAPNAYAGHFNRRKRRGVVSRTKPLTPKLRLEAAKAFEIRAQHADTQGQQRFEIRLRNGAQAEIRSHFMPAQNF